MTSLRRALHRPARARQRIAGIVAIGLLPALLAVIGWGDPHGIAGASAQDRAPAWHASAPASNAPATAVAAQPVSAWDRALAGLHGDGDLPQPAAALDLPPPSVPAARPLALAGTGLDHVRALQCLTAAIYYEAAREPDDGQRAVAQVVLNRVAHPAFPKTVCGVVYQGSERAGCQFSFACDGALAHAPMAAYWDRARRVAAAALAGSVYAPIGLSTHYHTGAVHPAWSDSMILQDTIGAHQFYRWTGNAGQPRAFSAVYAGGEPVAAPHPRTWVSTTADFADPLVLAQAFEAGRLAALRRAMATGPTMGIDPAIARVGAGFGQQPLPHGASSLDPVGAAGSEPARDTPGANRILPGSGAVRPDATQQYDSAAHWIHQPGA
ncbi:cell wall hydrolase [Novosphingobium sp.]|uniref:cell wall hydrolase n=1 Tax=Novosphingobium sp. TaxID=1874826 RepID=UPI00333F5C26